MTKFIEQRVDELENQVAKLELIIHELRGKKSIEPSTTNTVEDIIEFEGAKYRKVVRKAREGDVVIFKKTSIDCVTVGKPYKSMGDTFYDDEGDDIHIYNGIADGTPETVDVYELIEPKPLTPNQQRAEIIENAKKFVEENQDDYFHVEVDDEKRTVFTWKLITEGKIYKAMTGLASCHSDDVFNEHIGKAIALGRALGLDVSEFEQAVQPTVALGQKIFTLGYLEEFKFVDNEKWVLEVNGINEDGHPTHDNGTFTTHYKIINDTNAKYEVF